MAPLDSTRVMSGNFGQVWKDGRWLTNFRQGQASVEITKEDVLRSGTRWVGKKVVGLAGTGSISGYKVTTELIEEIGQIRDDRNSSLVTELILKLDDPDAFGAYRVRLKRVQFDTIPLINFEAGSLVEEELPFTFEDYELLDRITEE